MDIIFKFMDNFSKHLAPLPRRFPCGLPLDSVGYSFRKQDWVDRRFTSFNFSLILSGGGIFRMDGEEVKVKAPCVITQWPGRHMEYGPCGDYSSWEELYLIYSADMMAELRRRGLATERKVVWHIRRANAVLGQVRTLLDLLQNPETDGMTDRIDRLAENLIVETRLGELRPPVNRDEEIVRKIRQTVRENLETNHDFDRLAKEHGISPATFRRYWARYVHTPPARYVTHLRIRDACRMLAETDAPVAEIANELGFGDPLYFSRKFRHFTGVTASQYRKEHNTELVS
jgi:AraC-like DNA-binding protein